MKNIQTNHSAERHLWQLMEEVSRAGSLEDICSRALSSLRRIVAVERAAVLLLDEDGVMRFKASSGLSDAYQAAVQGHNPWVSGEAAEPILVDDVATDPSLAPFLGVLDRENIAALAFVPLRFADRLLGKFMLYHDAPHVFTEAEVLLAQLVAGHVSFAVERERTDRHLEQLYRREEEARRTAETALQRLAILAQASETAAQALDPDLALQQLAEIAVRTMADYCVAYRVESNGAARRVGGAHADPAQQDLVGQLAELAAPTLDDVTGAGFVLRTGQAILASEIDDAMLARAAQGEQHLEILRKLGPISSIIVPLQARGRTVGALALAATDRSVRRYGEADLILAQELANRVAPLVDTARLYTEARRATRSRDELLAIVSHDLRGPLNSVLLSSELLATNLPEARRDRTQASVRRAVAQMNRLIEDLLDVTQIEEGRLTLLCAPLDLAALLMEVVSIHAPVAEERGILLTQEIRGDGADLVADRARLSQALSNLVSNAVKFSPNGGAVEVVAEHREEALHICVSDTGAGIPAEQIPHLFDRFWRGNRASGATGVGLGLAIAKGIAESHGGTIEVSSSAGQGARFTLVLPH